MPNEPHGADRRPDRSDASSIEPGAASGVILVSSSGRLGDRRPAGKGVSEHAVILSRTVSDMRLRAAFDYATRVHELLAQAPSPAHGFSRGREDGVAYRAAVEKLLAAHLDSFRKNVAEMLAAGAQPDFRISILSDFLSCQVGRWARDARALLEACSREPFDLDAVGVAARSLRHSIISAMTVESLVTDSKWDERPFGFAPPVPVPPPAEDQQPVLPDAGGSTGWSALLARWWRAVVAPANLSGEGAVPVAATEPSGKVGRYATDVIPASGTRAAVQEAWSRLFPDAGEVVIPESPVRLSPEWGWDWRWPPLLSLYLAAYEALARSGGCDSVRLFTQERSPRQRVVMELRGKAPQDGSERVDIGWPSFVDVAAKVQCSFEEHVAGGQAVITLSAEKWRPYSPQTAERSCPESQDVPEGK